jgi:hypothetical protein
MLRALLCGVCFIALVAGVSAQTSQLDRAQMARDQAVTAPGPTVTTTGVEGNEIVASPNDADLGEQQILRRTEAYQPFLVSVDVPFYWTSNVALTNQGEQSDFLVSPVAAIAYQPRVTKDITAFVLVRDQQFYYDRFSDLDFGSFDVEVGLTYTVPQLHNLILHVGYDYNRLTKKNSFDDFFSNHVLLFTAAVPVRIDRAQQMFIGGDINISMTGTPDGPRRHDFDGYLTYSAQLTRALFASVSGRIVLHDYVLTERVDVTELLALNLTYVVNKWMSASAIASVAANQSNNHIFDYEVGNAGGTVSFSIRF